jgi:hypothetical protein
MLVSRSCDRMLSLADALTNAGNGSESIISHWGSEGPHVRGCLIVDSLLDRR